jgi:hypothetical protein
MKIQDNYDFSAYDVNIQQFAENVMHILNFGLYDVKYAEGSIPTWSPGVNEHPVLLMKFGASARIYVGDSNATNGWWYADLIEL